MPDETTPPPPSHRKRAMFIAIGIFAIIGLGYLCYWWFYSRFYEYTNDAYADGNMVFLTPQVSGIVTSLTVNNSDFVPQGRVLVQLDRIDATIALVKSVSALGSAVREVCGMFENVRELSAQIAMKKALFVKAAQDFEHRQGLIEEGAVSREDWEHAIAALQASFSDLMATEHQFISAVAQVENTTVESHPKVTDAKAMVREAYVNLQRCTLVAPVTGIVAQRSGQVGMQVHPGEPLLAIVPLDQMWATANFKEVQLTDMRIGQSVKVTADMWGDSVVFHGTVVGIGGGTGSVFSVLPPQNATGNWIKIVQRLPVRIGLQAEELKKHPLRLGLSLECTVDVHDTHKELIPPIPPDQPLYQTDVISTQEQGVDQLIMQTILDNLSPTFVEDMTAANRNMKSK
jgi:membrane fusion protein (multidrug efflux system)